MNTIMIDGGLTPDNLTPYERLARIAEDALNSLPVDDLRERAIELAQTTPMTLLEAVRYVKSGGW